MWGDPAGAMCRVLVSERPSCEKKNLDPDSNFSAAFRRWGAEAQGLRKPASLRKPPGRPAKLLEPQRAQPTWGGANLAPMADDAEADAEAVEEVAAKFCAARVPEKYYDLRAMMGGKTYLVAKQGSDVD
eukprot:7259981-Prymnesium_polylepis.1